MNRQSNSTKVNLVGVEWQPRVGDIRSFCAMLLCIDDELSTYKLVDNLQDLTKTNRSFPELEQAIRHAERGNIETNVENFTRYPHKAGLRVGIFSCSVWVEQEAVVLCIGEDILRHKEIVPEKAKKDVATEALDDLMGFYPIPRSTNPQCVESEILRIHEACLMRWFNQTHLDAIKEEAKRKVEASEQIKNLT